MENEKIVLRWGGLAGIMAFITLKNDEVILRHNFGRLRRSLSSDDELANGQFVKVNAKATLVARSPRNLEAVIPHEAFVRDLFFGDCHSLFPPYMRLFERFSYTEEIDGDWPRTSSQGSSNNGHLTSPRTQVSSSVSLDRQGQILA
jgi:hypothetical protein